MLNGTARKCLHVEVRRVGALTKETDMHAEDTIRPGNLTYLRPDSQSLLDIYGSNHASVTSGLDTPGVDFVILDSSATLKKKPAPELEAGFWYFCLLPGKWQSGQLPGRAYRREDSFHFWIVGSHFSSTRRS